MVNLKLLSPNLVSIIKEVLNNQNLCKLIYYNEKEPIAQENISDAKSVLFLKTILPYPFSDTLTEDTSQLRIYYPGGQFNGNHTVEDTTLHFDIIIAKNLWLIKVDDEEKLRPYEILSEILNTFRDNRIVGVGKVQFDNFKHYVVNEKYDCLRLFARVITYSAG